MCDIRTNYYSFNNSRIEKGDCIYCDPKSSIVDLDRMCITYCPLGKKNPLNDICIECINNETQDNTTEYCKEITPTKWVYIPINSHSFKLIPTRPILNKEIDYSNIFSLTVHGKNNSEELIDYTITPDVEK